jgi:hypothetical protein
LVAPERYHFSTVLAALVHCHYAKASAAPERCRFWR